MPFNPLSALNAWTSAPQPALQTMPPLPAWQCNDGSSGRPYLVYRYKSGPAQNSGVAWPATARLTLSACGQGFTAVRRPSVSVRIAKTKSSYGPGDYTCQA